MVQFFTIGLNPGVDTGSHILTLSINEGGDGYALDFLTVGVTTTGGTGATPEPGTMALLGLGGLAIAAAK